MVPHRPAVPPVHLRRAALPSTPSRSKRCASRSRSATPTSSSTSWATPGSSRSTRSSSGARPRCAPRPSFYADYVEPLVRDGDKKAVVIISDAMRYEVADELGSRIRQEDRFDADLEAVLGVLPSYTQLGMAALLPHSTLKHSADAKTVLADDQPTNGTAFREQDPGGGRWVGDPGRGLQGPQPPTSGASSTRPTGSCTSTTTGSTPPGTSPAPSARSSRPWRTRCATSSTW